jgi:hypothetical protein
MLFDNRYVRFVFLVVAACATAAGQQWVNLFDGKTLNGWAVHEGTGKIVVENGVIVGTPALNRSATTIPGAPGADPIRLRPPTSTFLCTTREYGDFILEFDVKMDPGVNTGVQFRSQISGPNTRVTAIRQGKQSEMQLSPDSVYGYQFEIVDAERGTTGNVYDEGRRSFNLDNSMKDRPGAATAFKDNEWNKCRVECRGDWIRTWVNGIACADVHDSMSPRGIIGLQVHNVAQGPDKPNRVWFRNVRIQEPR